MIMFFYWKNCDNDFAASSQFYKRENQLMFGKNFALPRYYL